MSGSEERYGVWLSRADSVLSPSAAPFGEVELGACSAEVVRMFEVAGEEQDPVRRRELLWELYEALCEVAGGRLLPGLDGGYGLFGVNSKLDLAADLRSVLLGRGFEFLPERLVEAPRPAVGSVDASAWRAWTLGLADWLEDRGFAHDVAREQDMGESTRRQIECNWYEAAVFAAAGVCAWAVSEDGGRRDEPRVSWSDGAAVVATPAAVSVPSGPGAGRRGGPARGSRPTGGGLG